MISLDDTQPRSPFKDPPPDESPAPGCLFWGLLGSLAMIFALAIVLLAGAAGWTAGKREANRHAAATQAELIGAQLIHLPTDVAANNPINVVRRLHYLETVAPNLPVVVEIRQTATAMYFAALPTSTPTPTESPTPTPTSEAALEVTPEIQPTQDSGYDLVGLLQTARQQIAAGQYVEAYNTLDAITRIDPNFQQPTVHGLLFEVLTTLARRAYRSTATLAEAIRYTDLAEQYGNIDQFNLGYERLIAGLYIDLQRASGAGDHNTAIRIINQILVYQSSYQGQDMRRLLFNEYIRVAEAAEFGAQYCQAVVQYNNALNLFADQSIVGRRDTAQMLCEQGTPTPEAEGLTPIAPIGAPGT